MALRILLLFSLSEILLANVDDPGFKVFDFITTDECCQDGSNRGNKGHDCTIIPAFSSSYTCRIIQEQCCSAAREMKLCLNGVVMALEQGGCEVPFFKGEPWEAKLSKICCDCCTFGLMIARNRSGCDFNHLLLNSQCLDTAKACCVNRTNEELNFVSVLALEVDIIAKPPVNCTGSPCSHFCIDNGTCGCFQGFQLKNDGVNCEDINECLAGTHNCFADLVCINTNGSFLCRRKDLCEPGYKFEFDTCQDINECALGIHECEADRLCVNTPGSFRCNPAEACPAGFTKDATGSCSDVNECVAHSIPCRLGETCVNTEGSFICHKNICRQGYHLSQDGTHCEDVDECETGDVCGDHGCVNLLGAYRCECRNGFYFNVAAKLCEDLNECRYYHGLCAHHCENTVGSYQCSCVAGFQLSNDGVSCDDVDECVTRPCGQLCANVYGSYQCYCHPGYQLSHDGMSCEDVDECALASRDQVCSDSCTNIPGSYYCTCPTTGYILGPNGQTCMDVDECATGIHTCSASESCFNIPGGFRCWSFSCPENFREVRRGRCERVACKLTQDPASCLSLPLRISFYNISFPINVPVPADIFQMGHSTSSRKDKFELAIVSGNEEGYFGVEYRARRGHIILRRPLFEARDFSLTVELRLSRSGKTRLYVAKIAVFATNGLSSDP